MAPGFKRGSVCAVAIAALLVLGAGRHAAAADHLKIGTPEASAFMFAILDVGIEKKIFAKHDLTIERIDFAGGGKLQEAMTAGVVDMALTGNSEMAFIAKGAQEKAVAVTAGRPVDMALAVRADGNITKPSDLKGKTIGVTSPTSLTAWLAMSFAQRQGWGPEGVKRASVGGMSSQIAALLVNNVDAIVGATEGVFLVEAKGKAKLLTTFGDIDPFITHAFYAREVLMKDRPEVLRRFILAWFETARFVRANKAETLKLVETATKLPPDIASKVYDLETPALSPDGRFDPKAIEMMAQSFLDLGLLDKRPVGTDLYTEAFLPK